MLNNKGRIQTVNNIAVNSLYSFFSYLACISWIYEFICSHYYDNRLYLLKKMNEHAILTTTTRLANAPYKIFDWDQEEPPLSHEKVIENHYTAEEIIDEGISPNEYGRAKFISEALMIENSGVTRPPTSHEDDDEPKFWRRKDLLIPGKSIQISSKITTVQLLSEEEPIEESDDDYEEDGFETMVNQDRCIYIGSILSETECSDLIDSTSRLGYEKIDKEYPKEYLNNERVLVKSKKLADIIWSRIVPFLKKSDIDGVKPYGFDNGGCWVPCGINEVLRFNKYSRGSFFKPHTDAQFVRNDNEKSIFTVLIYLSSFSSTATFWKKVGEKIEDNNISFDFKQLACIDSKEGSVGKLNRLLLNNNLKPYLTIISIMPEKKWLMDQSML